MTFQVFKKIVTRETACRLIAQDIINQVVNGGDHDMLMDILIDGTQGVDQWENEDIKEYLGHLLAENYTADQLKEMGIL